MAFMCLDIIQSGTIKRLTPSMTRHAPVGEGKSETVSSYWP